MIKIGLIGCGFMGSMHANCYKALGGVQVTAVADVRQEFAEKLAALSGAKIYRTGMELIADAKVDAIDICLPTYLHAEHAVAAMKRVPYVFVEKPVALDEKQADEMLKAQAETGAGVQVGQVIRFWDEYVWIKSLIDSGKYGKVRHAALSRLSPRPTWSWNNWVLDAKLSGGALEDLHVHDADFMLYAFGTPKSTRTVKNHGTDDNSYVSSVCDYGDFAVSLEGSWDLPAEYPFEMYIRVRFDSAVAEYSSVTGAKLYADGKATVPEIEPLVKSDAKVEGGNISSLGGYLNELSYFTDCIKAGKKPAKATLCDAAKSVAFIRSEISAK